MSSWLQLAHKTAVVTGAASGIGRAVATALATEHCRVILVDTNEVQLEQVATECLRLSDNEVDYVLCNVAKESQVQALFRQPELFGDSSKQEPASILVNCAGITRDGWVGRMSLDQWQQVLDVNLTGTFLCCREFLAQPGLQPPPRENNDNSDINITNTPKNHSGKIQSVDSAAIINISSVVATQGNLAQVNYAASKGGVWSMTKALAKEVAHRNIRVNCVLPGFIETDMTNQVPHEIRDKVIRPKIAFQQKFGRVDDVANLCLFLASCHRSGYITGQAIECSGMISL